MTEADLQKIEEFCDCDPPCEACKTSMALIAEIRRYWKEIDILSIERNEKTSQRA